MALTKGQALLVARMRELIEEGTWHAVPSHSPTIRYTDTQTTHPAQLGDGFGRWPEPNYSRHVFVTLAGGSVILGVASAPWMGRSDSSIPLWLATEILKDPTLAFDDTRRWAMRDARKAARP